MSNPNFNFSSTDSCAVVFVEALSSPEAFLNDILKELQPYDLEQILIIATLNFNQPWEENNKILEIVYLYLKNQNVFELEKVYVQEGPELFLQKSGVDIMLENNPITLNSDRTFYIKIKAEVSAKKSFFSPNEPFLFDPIFIPKPWGQEIWYTGVEKRGVSKIAGANSKFSFPIPWLLTALPNTILGNKYAHKNLVLIKILDPFPEEVVGDLYYELHQEKNEVYVVTDITAKVGRIKMGINKEKIEKYKNNISLLKSDFLEVIQKYEVVRRKIDAIGNPFEEKNKIPQTLQEQEMQLRKNMDDFAGYLDLNIGDVICVPILVPHALQHGVRVIEFQTPTYERLIISFAQKVLTQNHWDTELAFEKMEVKPPSKMELNKLTQNSHYTLEQVCDFPDFYAVRINIEPLKEYVLNAFDSYQVIFVVKGKGELVFHGVSYPLENTQCILLPANASGSLLAHQELCVLVCTPKKYQFI